MQRLRVQGTADEPLHAQERDFGLEVVTHILAAVVVPDADTRRMVWSLAQTSLGCAVMIVPVCGFSNFGTVLWPIGSFLCRLAAPGEVHQQAGHQED